MRKIVLSLGSLVILGFAVPASAQTYGWGGRHHEQHDQLQNEHGDTHHQLSDEHSEAHEYRLSHREHHQLHRDLRYQHEEEDYRLRREHQLDHQYNNHQNYGRDWYNGY